MDPWKPIRLWLCLGVIVALLAVGSYARLVWGVPEEPYGWTYVPIEDAPNPYARSAVRRSPNSLRELRVECGAIGADDARHIEFLLRTSRGS